MPIQDAVSIEDSDNDSIANIQDEDEQLQTSSKTKISLEQISEIVNTEKDIRKLEESNTKLEKVFIII